MNKEYEASQLNNIESKYEICYERKLGSGMHTVVYECKRKFDIDDKSSSDFSADPDQRRVSTQL